MICKKICACHHQQHRVISSYLFKEIKKNLNLYLLKSQTLKSNKDRRRKTDRLTTKLWSMTYSNCWCGCWCLLYIAVGIAINTTVICLNFNFMNKSKMIAVYDLMRWRSRHLDFIHACCCCWFFYIDDESYNIREYKIYTFMVINWINVWYKFKLWWYFWFLYAKLTLNFLLFFRHTYVSNYAPMKKSFKSTYLT